MGLYTIWPKSPYIYRVDKKTGVKNTITLEYFKCIFHPDPDCKRENMWEIKESTLQRASDAAFRTTKFHSKKD